MLNLQSIQKQSSLLSALGCTSIQEMLLGLTSIEELSEAMRKAGLERTNLIFGKLVLKHAIEKSFYRH